MESLVSRRAAQETLDSFLGSEIEMPEPALEVSAAALEAETEMASSDASIAPETALAGWPEDEVGVVVPAAVDDEDDDVLAVGAELGADFFEVLYAPPAGLGDDDDDLPSPLGM